MRLALRPVPALALLSLAFLAFRRQHPRSAGIYVALPADSLMLGCSDLF